MLVRNFCAEIAYIVKNQPIYKYFSENEYLVRCRLFD